MIMKIKLKKQEKGFTLVEMLVSISLFAVVITMSVGTLLVLIDANGRAQSMQLVMTNLSFSLDSMTREIRTGFNWYCGTHSGSPGTFPVPTENGDLVGSVNDCGSGNYISIVESGNSLTDNLSACSADPSTCSHRISYWFVDDYYGTNHGAILRLLGRGEGGNWVPLTGPDLSVDNMNVVVAGTDRWTINNDVVQPNATLFIKGRAGFDSTGNNSKVKEFSLQTSISQMLLDI